MNNLRHRLKDQRGFNLIELMIVIAIIGLLIGVGTIAWNAVIKSGNETAAAQSVDLIRKLQAQYAAKNRGNFGTFEDLINKVGLDDKFRGERPVINGYVFSMTVEPTSPSKPAFYSINADPQVAEGVSATGSRHFYFDSNLSTIKTNDEGLAKPDDPSM
jgi:prepilin-type N-terminal cleavage/methylation domain-containing protein